MGFHVQQQSLKQRLNKYASCVEGAGSSSFSVQVVVLPVKIVRRKVVFFNSSSDPTI